MAPVQTDPAIDLSSSKAQNEIRKKQRLLQNHLDGKPSSRKHSTEDRIPPGNHHSRSFQVLDLGHRPALDLASWSLTCASGAGEVAVGVRELEQLGVVQLEADFHCVTTWSALSVKWTKALPFSTLVQHLTARGIVPSDWQWLVQTGRDGYVTVAPREDLEREEVHLVWELDGAPIPPEHGIVRIIIPHLYGWKSAKFLQRIEFAREYRDGFWEKLGYHERGNVWFEERFKDPNEDITKRKRWGGARDGTHEFEES
ncbi:molybdopterin binding oxidoreductase [Gonapodya prolifera JEL478]|uniref:Molybdopterin binding oxidoreductase n=1 Tax=Gonapodya prolifera (strain JEL478) TaxID=1344416 RepID=A0A139AR13_GONPJ|nr:molybdopterin binding oxidoreductase [Gonapodya prolifera JEL478]|eukprot:KXS19169.1 molybdopterin binding oxidoreductase [Gonapodya prolifera JEL478]